MPRLFVSLAVAVALGASFAGGCQEPVNHGATLLDLNRATEKQLEALPAIGPTLARSIIASRNARGGRFARLDDLLKIDGVGPKTLETLRAHVVVY